MPHQQLRRDHRQRAVRLTPRQLTAHGQHHAARVIAQHVHAMGEERVHGVGVQVAPPALELRTRRDPAHARQPQGAEQAYPQPADVDLPALHREARRARERVVIIVQLLAAEQQRPGHEVGRGGRHLEAAVTDRVPEPVDDAAGKERLRHEVHGDHHDARNAEQQQVRGDEHHDAVMRVCAVEAPFEPVLRRTAPVVLQRLGIVRRDVVQLIALEQHAPQSKHHRTVRIARLIGVRMVAAVDRDPLLGDRSGAEPQPEAEHVPERGVQDEAAVGLITVQVQRHPEKHRLDGDEGHQRIAPHGQLDQAIGQETHPGALLRRLSESGAEG